MLTGLTAAHKEVSFPSPDGGVVWAPEPKELLILDGSAHAQFLFETDQGERLMSKLLDFLPKP